MISMWFKHAHLYYKGVFHPNSSFCIENGFFTHVLPTSALPQELETAAIDVKHHYVVPGFLDQHVHGSVGFDFMDASVEGNLRISKYLPQLGVTSFLATTLTASMADTLLAVSAINGAFHESLTSGAECIGIHLEGPFISRDKKGAHAEEWVIPPKKECVSLLIESSGLPIKMVTYSPENDINYQFTTFLKAHAIVPSIGHSKADYATVKGAFHHGACCVTHCYNAMSSIESRNGNVLGAALDIDGLWVELISDLVHVSSENMRLFHRSKPRSRRILVSDAMRARGLPPGTYTLGKYDVVSDGVKVMTKNGTLAGSVLKQPVALKHYMETTGASLPETIDALSVNPASLLGVDHKKGSIEIGKDADFVLLNTSYDVVSTYCKGVNRYTCDDNY